MCGKVLVALLVSVVLGDEVQVFAADDKSTVHLGGHNGSGQDTATDGDLANEGALLVCRAAMSAILIIKLACRLLRKTDRFSGRD